MLNTWRRVQPEEIIYRITPLVPLAIIFMHRYVDAFHVGFNGRHCTPHKEEDHDQHNAAHWLLYWQLHWAFLLSS